MTGKPPVVEYPALPGRLKQAMASRALSASALIRASGVARAQFYAAYTDGRAAEPTLARLATALRVPAGDLTGEPAPGIAPPGGELPGYWHGVLTSALRMIHAATAELDALHASGVLLQAAPAAAPRRDAETERAAAYLDAALTRTAPPAAPAERPAAPARGQRRSRG